MAAVKHFLGGGKRNYIIQKRWIEQKEKSREKEG
jgi:hypothetical protein